MSTNRNKEQEQAYILADVKDYIKEEGARFFLTDLNILFPEAYQELIEAVKHKINMDLNQTEVPALLRNYRA